MLEEANGFFLDWGYAWLGWYSLFIMSLFMIFGPFLMCYQTTKTYKWVQAQREKQNNLSVEEDDEFEADETIEQPAEESKEPKEQAKAKKESKK